MISHCPGEYLKTCIIHKHNFKRASLSDQWLYNFTDHFSGLLPPIFFYLAPDFLEGYVAALIPVKLHLRHLAGHVEAVRCGHTQHLVSL